MIFGSEKGASSPEMAVLRGKLMINHWILEVPYFQTKVSTIGRTGETPLEITSSECHFGALTIATGSSGRGLAAAGG